MRCFTKCIFILLRHPQTEGQNVLMFKNNCFVLNGAIAARGKVRNATHSPMVVFFVVHTYKGALSAPDVVKCISSLY